MKRWVETTVMVLRYPVAMALCVVAAKGLEMFLRAVAL